MDAIDIKSLACRLQVSDGFRTFEIWEQSTGKLLYQYQELAEAVRVHTPGALPTTVVRQMFEHVCESAVASIPKTSAAHRQRS